MIRKIFLVIIFCSSSLFAQFNSLKDNQAMLAGGAGLTWINGQPFYTVHLFPEVAFSNYGIGLDLSLEFGADGKLRKENFNEFSDYLSIIRYFRYGIKGDPLYFRLGALDYATLGHGSIMYLYNNSPSYDTRKTGLELDIDFGLFGIESVYSTFGEAGVVGVRGFTRPLQFTEAKDIPVLGQLEAGATIAADFNANAGVIDGEYNSDENRFSATSDEGKTFIIGFDLGLPIVRNNMFNFDLYFDYVKILEFGDGAATGIKFGVNGLGLVSLHTKFERRFNDDQYLPSYFNSLYEVQRFQLDKESGTVLTKAQQLKAATDIGNGWYGELLVSVLNTFDILGSYQRLDKHPDSGILHLETDVSPKGMPYIARAGYDKINIIDESDLFKLDDRSLLYFEFGYKPLPYMIVSMFYNWTFEPIRDADNNVIDYRSQKKIEPRVTFIYPFDF
ncbi:MAG: hypothetical protein V1720_09880 [bacterium]